MLTIGHVTSHPHLNHQHRIDLTLFYSNFSNSRSIQNQHNYMKRYFLFVAPTELLPLVQRNHSLIASFINLGFHTNHTPYPQYQIFTQIQPQGHVYYFPLPFFLFVIPLTIYPHGYVTTMACPYVRFTTMWIDLRIVRKTFHVIQLTMCLLIFFLPHYCRALLNRHIERLLV